MKMFQHVTEWVLRIVWTNILWIGFTLLGLVIFGIMPATVALFTVTRRWTRKELNFSIWHVFKNAYVKEWKKSNLIGSIFFVIGFILVVDLRFLTYVEGLYSLFLYIFFVFLLFMLMMTLTFFFPLYVHYDFSVKDYLKQSFIYSFVSFKETIKILLGLFFIGFLIYRTPGFIPFLTGVLPAYWIMNVCMKKFRYLEEKYTGQEGSQYAFGKQAAIQNKTSI